MVDIEFLSRKYFSKGEPCPYKLKSGIEILIYPILVKDYNEYEDCRPILEFDKNTINDVEVIKMSQLEYLNFLFSNRQEVDGVNIGEVQLQMFKGIFSLCLKEDYVAIAKNEKGKFIVVVAEKDEKDEFIVKYTITNKEYLDIVKIILYQNDFDYNDQYVSPDVLEEYNEMMKLKTKGMKNPTLEERKIFVLSRYRCTLQDLDNMTYRLFDMLYNEYVGIEQYYVEILYKTSEKFDVKENIVYPLFKPKEDRFKDLFMSTDSLNSKLGNQ
jgi:hypothetical protein